MTSRGIGERLRNAREARGLSLDEIEAGTRIRRRYLEALEAEAFAEIPGPAYVKGFLRTYATYLGLSPDDLVALFPELSPGPIVPPWSAAAPGSGGSAVEVRITPAMPRSRVRRVIGVITALVIAGVFLVGYKFYGEIRQFTMTPRPVPPVDRAPAAVPAPHASAGPTAAPSPAPTSPGPSAQSPAAMPSPAATPSPGTSPVPGAPGPAASSPGSPLKGAPQTPGTPPLAGSPAPRATQLHVEVAATDRTWVRAVADGATVFEGFLSAGTREAWDARRVLSLKVGNASGLDVSVNGRPLGPLGKPGDVVDRTFTAGGPVSP